ncbi:DUF2142 domain-containing protein [Glaciibacter flavus]|uniref:DUF2142 domain-containing protein n=1 Tax=Orlajensenia flava TaxID=2565934 RepID=UPI003B001F90
MLNQSPSPDSGGGVPARVGQLRIFIVSWILLSLLSVMWTLATPISASPDEPAHIVKAAAVVRGELGGTPTPHGHIVRVPQYIAFTQAQTCFAFKPDEPASCAPAVPGDPGRLVDGSTTAGRYNPLYYAVVGWPSLLFDDVRGIYAMRMVSGVFTALFLAFAILLALGWRESRIVMLSIGVAIPPMLLFLSGSINPNGVESAATLAAFLAVLAIVLRPDDRLLTLRCAILIASGIVAANARAISPLWLAIAVLLPLVLCTGARLRSLISRPQIRWSIAIVGLGCVAAIGWILVSNSLAAGLNDPTAAQVFPGQGGSAIGGFTHVLRETFGYAQGMVGIFGWLDTPAPLVTYFTWAALTGAILFAGVGVLRGRAAAFACSLVAALVFLPAIVQGVYITGGGLIWQGRYALALFAMAVVGIAAVLAERATDATASIVGRITFAGWLLWAVSQFASFATALHRYAVGSNGTWGAVIRSPEWTAPGGNVALLIGMGLLTVASAWLAWRVGSGNRPIRASSPADRTPGARAAQRATVDDGHA